MAVVLGRCITLGASLVCSVVLLYIWGQPLLQRTAIKLLVMPNSSHASCYLARQQAEHGRRKTVQQAMTLCYNSSWLPQQRPLQGSTERSLVTGVLETVQVWASPSPPSPADIGPVGSQKRAEVLSRLIVAIGCGVSTKGFSAVHVSNLPLIKTLVASFLPTAQAAYIYRFYFAYDHDDPMLAQPQWRDDVAAAIAALVADEDARRWHPQDFVHGQTIDPSSIMVSVHWVRCNYSGKPSWAHSDAIMAAFKDGADYAMRINDDTLMPARPDWVEAFIADLRSRRPISNLGVVGPWCDLNPRILTHDFTHKTHGIIFGYHYPRSLPDWSSDDWIDELYRKFNLSRMLKDVSVIHNQVPRRYSVTDEASRNVALWAEVNRCVQVVQLFARSYYGVDLQQRAM